MVKFCPECGRENHLANITCYCGRVFPPVPLEILSAQQTAPSSSQSVPKQKANIDKQKRAINIAGPCAIASWPAGFLLGWFLSIGQDPAGEAMAYPLGILLVVIPISGPACIVLLWCSRGDWSDLGVTQKILVLASIVPFVFFIGPFLFIAAVELLYGLAH